MAYLYVFTAFFGICMAATPFKQALDVKTNKYIDKGTVVGGQSGQAFSLIRVRSQLSPKKDLERIVLNMGDESGRLLKGRMSYYQVNLEQNPPRLVIDLSQVTASKVSDVELRKVFMKSPFVRSVQMLPDPEGASTTLVLNLKKTVKAEVFNLKGKGSPGRLVIDLKQ